MPHARKDSKYWQIRYKNKDGKTIREATNFPIGTKKDNNYQLAQQLEQEKQRPQPVENTLTFDEILEKYIRYHQDKKTIDRDELSLKHLRPHFSGKKLKEIKKIDLLNYKQTRKQHVSIATINKEVGLIQTAINWYNDTHELNLHNPAKGMR